MFCATGITTGDIIEGVKREGDFFCTETLITHKSQNIVKKIIKKYNSKWDPLMVLIGKLEIYHNDL